MSKYSQTSIKSLDHLPPSLKTAFVVAERNKDYTQSLADLNAQVFVDHWYTQPDIFWVPGSLELPGFANRLLLLDYDIVIVFGVIIKGKTMHYEFISQAIFQGIVQLSITYPQHVLISWVLTVEDESLLQERVTDNYARAALNLYSEQYTLWS